eukprot:4920496-Prymnesium_polylepis.2
MSSHAAGFGKRADGAESMKANPVRWKMAGRDGDGGFFMGGAWQWAGVCAARHGAQFYLYDVEHGGDNLLDVLLEDCRLEERIDLL